MKKLLSLLTTVFAILILTAFCFVGCSNSSDSSGNKPSGNKPSGNQNNKPQTSKYNITSISEFYNGLARFQTSDGNYGYLDVNGKVVIEPIYTSAQKDFDENAALVSKDGTEMLIDRKGNVLTKFDFDFDAIGTFENGFIWIQTKEETISKNVPVMNYYNEKGQKAFSVKDVSHVEALWDSSSAEIVDHLNPYSTFNKYGYAFVSNSQTLTPSYQLIDKNGNFADFIPSDLYIRDIYGNYITLQKDYSSIVLYYYIDYINEELIPIQNNEILKGSKIELKNVNAQGNKIYAFCKNSVVHYVPNTDLGNVLCNMLFLASKNEIIINLQDIFPEASYFKAIESSVYNNKTYYTIYMKNQNGVAFYSVIDENGQILISPTQKYNLGYSYSKQSTWTTYTYYQAYSFCAGLCKAKDSETGLFGFIDLQGNWVIQPQYKNVTDFSEYGNDAYAIVDDVTVINKKGEIVFTAKQTKS